jgi:hypothetical protein
MYNYELVGYFSSGDRTSNALLGTVAINENDLSGGHRDEYLLGLARSNFGGTISKEENRINGQLTRVMANRKGRADGDGKKKKSGGGLGGWLKDQIMKPYKP